MPMTPGLDVLLRVQRSSYLLANSSAGHRRCPQCRHVATLSTPQKHCMTPHN